LERPPHATTVSSEVRRSIVVGYLLFALYLLVIAWLTWTHTFWRDECQAWLIARASHSLPQLLHNTRHEGHPPLWFLVLYAITHVTANPAWMKLPNLLCAVASAGLLFRARHLPLWTRLGILFSYYFFFEYTLIARNYMIGVLFLLYAVTRLRERDEADPWVFASLSLAALTSAPALIVAVCVAACSIAPFVFPARRRPPAASRFGWPHLASIAAFALICLGSAATIRPPADSDQTPNIAFYRLGARVNFEHTGRDIATAYLPIPPWHRGFWNLTILDNLPTLPVALGGWLLVVLLCLLLRRRSTRAFFIASSLLILALACVTQKTYLRHIGWLFILFVLALLLDRPASIHAEPDKQRPWRNSLLGAVLGVQVYAGLFACAVSFRYPFAPSRRFADFLIQNHLQNAELIPIPEFIGLAPMAYLQRDSFYSMAEQREVPFLKWTRATNDTFPAFIHGSQTIPAPVGAQPQAVILFIPLWPAILQQNHLHLVATFTGDICANEVYYLYERTP
jgi:hypothetical protein